MPKETDDKKLAILNEVIDVKFHRKSDDKIYYQRVKIKTLQNKQVLFKCTEDRHKHIGVIVAFNPDGNPIIYTHDKVTPIIDDDFCVII